MTGPDRLVLLLLVIAWTAWRLVRYLRLATAKRPATMGIPVSGLAPKPQLAVSSSQTDGDNPLSLRPIGLAVAILIWVIGNGAIWGILFGAPFLKNAPPIPLGIVGVFANFYLIPWARGLGLRCQRRWQRDPPAGAGS